MLLLSSVDFFQNEFLQKIFLEHYQSVNPSFLSQASKCECVFEYFFYFSTKTYVVGMQKNYLSEHPKHMFKLMDK